MEEYQLYKGIWDYVANSPCVAQTLIIGISFIAGVGAYSIVDKCSKLNNLRKQKKSKLEENVKGEK